MTREPTRRLVPLVLIGAIVFVALNGWMALGSVKWLERSERQVAHTWQVIAQVERMMSSAKDAETGSRGYLITGNERFLEPYRAAQRTLLAELASFEKLTEDNASQQVRAKEMRVVIERRLELLEEANELRMRLGNGNTPHALQLMDAGKEQMDRLRRIADSMQGEERRLLADRMRESVSAASRVRSTLLLASALDLLLILFMFRYFLRERGLRLSAEHTAQDLAQSRIEVERKAAEIHGLNEGLEARVQQRTAELQAVNRELEAFSYSVSHDLRAPLRTIDGFSLALEEDYGEVVGAEGKDYIKRVRTGVQRMGGLIDALLQLSRITRAEIERETVDVTALAESVAAQIVNQSAEQVIHFSIEQSLQAEADPKLLRVALENLFGNAVKFSSKKPGSSSAEIKRGAHGSSGTTERGSTCITKTSSSVRLIDCTVIKILRGPASGLRRWRG